MNEPSDAWVKVRSDYGPDLKLFRARFDLMRNPRNQKTERMIVLESQDSVNVVAITPDEQMLFVRQYRFGIEAETLELPGGIVDAGEAPLEAARRELREETGFTGLQWNPLGRIPSNPVFQTSYIHHWLVTGIEQTETLELDDGEMVTLESIPLETVRQDMFRERFQHPHTLSALIRFFGQYTP